MRKFLFLALVLVGLAGCVTALARYGNFIQRTTPANDTANGKKMADDVVKKLLVLYPPAITRFDLQHATSDYFGTCLVETMRAKGYAISEFGPKHKKVSATTLATGAQVPAGLPLSYILDQVKDSGLYRVTVTVNRQQSLDRVYQVAQDGLIYPAGSWARKE